MAADSSRAEDDPAAARGPAALRVGERERLEYMAGMICELSDMARSLHNSSLHAILDAAMVEARLQVALRQD